MDQFEQTTRPGAVAIRSGNWKAVSLGLVSVIFVAGGCWMIVDGPAGIRIVGLLNVAAFGFAAARFLQLTFRTRPALVIDDAGLFDYCSAIAAGFIPWSDIDGVFVPRFSAQANMGIFVADVEKIFSRLPSWKVRLMRINRGLMGTPINVPVGLLRIRREELVALLREKRPGISILPDDEGDSN